MQRIVIAAALSLIWIGSGYFLLSGKVSQKVERPTAHEPAAHAMISQAVAAKEPSDDLIAKAIQATDSKPAVPVAKAKTAVVASRPAGSVPSRKEAR